MKHRSFGLGAVIAVCGLVAACSDETTTAPAPLENGSRDTSPTSPETSGDTSRVTSSGTPNGTSGGPPGDSPGNVTDKCKIADGTYAIEYSNSTPPSAGCKDGEVGAFSYPADGGADAPLSSACKVTSEDKTSCTKVVDCTFPVSGYTTTTHSETTITNGRPSGKMSSKMVKDADGSTSYECAQDFIWQKK